ncbi:hypothetical protein M407DRAFT_216431 [Tulasnella calospora MUT 4182]|uniref:Uncharacterized protein n=1 Tax=Tulasnella calospora MUT 4182 TaxID=1051891 RepID=A0A0C3LM54_9AGAM|nr:hypothetical protein M407DRAFT_216431 [Tulasnella calospora MUT 4182]
MLKVSLMTIADASSKTKDSSQELAVTPGGSSRIISAGEAEFKGKCSLDLEVRAGALLLDTLGVGHLVECNRIIGLGQLSSKDLQASSLLLDHCSVRQPLERRHMIGFVRNILFCNAIQDPVHPSPAAASFIRACTSQHSVKLKLDSANAKQVSYLHREFPPITPLGVTNRRLSRRPFPTSELYAIQALGEFENDQSGQMEVLMADQEPGARKTVSSSSRRVEGCVDGRLGRRSFPVKWEKKHGGDEGGDVLPDGDLDSPTLWDGPSAIGRR